MNPRRVEASGLDFRYYNANIHWASFQLPSFLLKEYKTLLSELPEVSYR
jgi:spermidine synthase